MITWDAICKVVEPMKTIGIERKDKNGKVTTKEYATVPERVKAFRQICPAGCISTEILSLTDEMVVMKTTITDENGQVLGTGMAFERPDSSYINKTSFIENCETSAVGRALGMLAIGVDASMASADELVNAIVNQERIKQNEKADKEIAASEQGAKNASRLKELSAKTGLSTANMKDWKAMAIDNHFIPDKKWAEYTDSEIDAFIRFVEMNVDARTA